MEKSPDLEEWEILSDDGFLDFHHKDGKSGIDKKEAVDMNYFICPSPFTGHHLQNHENSTVARGSNKLIPVPIRLEPMGEKNPDEEIVKEIVEISVESKVVLEKMKDPNWVVGDQDPISQVFFKKMKENEFVDMKLDSPKSSGRGIKSQIELGSIQFEEKDEDLEEKTSKAVIEQETGKKYAGSEMKEKGCWEGCGLNIWRWRVTGNGAICSMGVAAAAICIFIFGSHQRQKQNHQNQKLRFQIYADDKSIKQVVQQATRLNQALSSVRGVPLTRAHITFGGYYDSP